MMTPLAGSYHFDRFVVDAKSACLRRDGVVVPLRPKSFDVLLYLVRNRGRLASKDELFDSVWANVVVTDNSLVQCIKEVRQALGDDAQTMVETVAKRGYVFTTAVVEVDTAAQPAALLAPAGTTPAWTQPGPTQSLPPRRGAAVAITGGIAAVLIAAGGVWWALTPGALPRPPAESVAAERQAENRLSIAVLPFGILGETADDYFSIGISEDVAAALGRFPDLAVASPKVVSRLRSAGVSAEDIQRELKVRYLVEGSVRRSAERVRIAVRTACCFGRNPTMRRPPIFSRSRMISSSESPVRSQ